MSNNKKKGNPIVMGVMMLGGAIAALWQNEFRFDYHKAASETVFVERISSLEDNAIFSHTGDMDQSLTLKREYAQEFIGYLIVMRRAEIYAWDRDEDDDGVTWSKEWMSNLESNSCNRGLRQEQTFFRSSYLLYTTKVACPQKPLKIPHPEQLLRSEFIARFADQFPEHKNKHNS